MAAGGGAEEQQHKGDKEEAEGGTKRTLTYLWKLLTARGHDVLKIQDDIKTLIVKSLVLLRPAPRRHLLRVSVLHVQCSDGVGVGPPPLYATVPSVPT